MAQEQAAAKALLGDLAETQGYSLGRPLNTRLTPDGACVLFLRSGPRDSVRRLFELDVQTGEERELLTPEAVLGGRAEELSVEERARRERMRLSARGFASFQLSRDGKFLLLPLSGRLYLYDRTGGNVTTLPGEDWIDPQFSPDVKFVASVRDNDLFAIDLSSGHARRLTTGGSQTLTNGLAEFVAQEEMHRFHGFWWSPDSTTLAYQQNDLTPVETLYIANPLHPEAPPTAFRYPRPGTPNAIVRLGLVPVIGGETTWASWDIERFPYLARVVWAEGGPLSMLVQTRNQQEERLLAVDPASGGVTELLRETDPAWVNLTGDGQTPRWLKDGACFLWATERRGDWQLELRAPDGGLVHELTTPEFAYRDLVDVDESRRSIVVRGGSDRLQAHLFRMSLDSGEAVQLTTEPGHQSAFFAEDHRTWLHHYHLSDGRSGIDVRRDQEVLRSVRSMAEEPPFLPAPEIIRLNGTRTYDAAVLRPRQFEAGRKYPVILSVYAGPGGKVVTKLPQAYLRDQILADQGYVVVRLDGRGTPGHGREWERAIRGNLIDVPLEDQVDGLQALGAAYPELDMTRVGVTGWSFGGYFSAMAVLRRPDVFHCAVAGAPVTDWHDYDTHYTERYLDLPSVNPQGYDAGSAMTYAAGLDRPLLLIHGLTDDNVYFIHTLKLAQALFHAGRPFDLLPLTGTHMVRDADVTLRLQDRVQAFFAQHLRP